MPIYDCDGTYTTYTRAVRYIRDSVNGSTANTSSHWVEIQALDSAGSNIANGKTATLISGTSEGQNLSLITNGDMTSANYFGANGTNPTVQIDLGAIYDIVNIKVWHYFADGRTYYSPVTQVSSDGSNWTTISNGSTYAESSSGKTWSCASVPSLQVPVQYEIGKLYDNDGTSNYQIGKVYDNDGTTNYLIYSSEENLLSKSWTVLNENYYNVNGSIRSKSDASMTVICGGAAGWAGGMANIYTAALNVNGFNKITVDVSEFYYSADHIKYARFGLASSLDAAKAAGAFIGQGNAKALGMDIASTSFTSTGTFTCNIPAGTTSAIIVFALGGLYEGPYDGGERRVTFTKFLME